MLQAALPGREPPQGRSPSQAPEPSAPRFGTASFSRAPNLTARCNTWEASRHIHKLSSQEFHSKSQHKSHCTRNKEPWLHSLQESRGPSGICSQTMTHLHLPRSKGFPALEETGLFFSLEELERAVVRTRTVISQCCSAPSAPLKGQGVHDC